MASVRLACAGRQDTSLSLSRTTSSGRGARRWRQTPRAAQPGPSLLTHGGGQEGGDDQVLSKNACREHGERVHVIASAAQHAASSAREQAPGAQLLAVRCTAFTQVCCRPARCAAHAPASRLKGAKAKVAAVSTMSSRIRRLRPASSSMLMYSCWGEGEEGGGRQTHGPRWVACTAGWPMRLAGPAQCWRTAWGESKTRVRRMHKGQRASRLAADCTRPAKKPRTALAAHGSRAREELAHLCVLNVLANVAQLVVLGIHLWQRQGVETTQRWGSRHQGVETTCPPVCNPDYLPCPALGAQAEACDNTPPERHASSCTDSACQTLH